MPANHMIEKEGNRGLDSQLAAYSAAAQAELALEAGRARRANRPIAAYSTAAAGAGLLGALNVDAAIQYTPANLTLKATNGSTLLNIDGAGGNDFKLTWAGAGKTRNAMVSGLTASADVARDGNWGVFNYAKNFAYGNTISAGQATSWPSKGSFWYYTVGSWRGNFSNVNTGYVGIRFNSGGVKYGWIHIDSIAAGNTEYHVAGYAYEDSGGAIDAGDQGGPAPVPEPSTIALALLASGAAGVMRSRRKKILKGRSQ